MLARGHNKNRPYSNKPNFKMIQESFDPIRIKLRVIPKSKAPEPKGFNADYYFKLAGKKSIQGELPQAIYLLKRGLL